MTSLAALMAAAERSGCTVCDVRFDSDGEMGATLACGGGWDAARLLYELAQTDLHDPEVVEFARRLRRATGTEGSDVAFSRVVFNLVSQGVRFERETGELFRGPLVVLSRRVGDCDCQARCVYALLAATGVPTRLAFLGAPGGDPKHVVAQVQTPRGWKWLETTVPGARWGEHPIAAAQRTGALNRDDIGDTYEEVATMGGPFGVFGGGTYRARIGCDQPRTYLPDSAESCVRRGLEALGFRDVTVWLDGRELPADWRADTRGDVPDALWTAFAEGLYARPESTMVEGVVTSPAPLWISDLWQAPVAPVEMTTMGATTPAAVPVVHTKDLSPGFFVGLKAMARRVNRNPEHLLEVMLRESDISAAAGYDDGPNKASGISQIVYLDKVGYEGTHAEFKRLTAEQQLPYVERWWAPYKGYSLPTAANLYQLNFVPMSVERGTGSGTVVVAENGTGYNGQEAKFYTINKALDRNRDGTITVADLAVALEETKRARAGRWNEALARLRAAPDPGPAVAPVIAGLAVIGAVGLAHFLGT